MEGGDGTIAKEEAGLAPRVAPAADVVDCKGDLPGPRCGHTLTSIAAVGQPGSSNYIGPRLVLFGGASALEGAEGAGGTGIRLAGATADVHSFDIESQTWTKLQPTGDPPSARAAHAAAAVGTMVVIQGGIGPANLATDDLHVLDMAGAKPRFHRIVMQGRGPNSRYGHVMSLVGQRYILLIGGNDGRGALADVWALDTATKPYEWKKIEPEGEGPPPFMYATATSRQDGLVVVSGGRNEKGTPLSGTFGLVRHRTGRWQWGKAPGVPPSPRYQHTAAFVGARMHVAGGTLGSGHMVDTGASAAVLDTAAGVWMDSRGVVSGPRPEVADPALSTPPTDAHSDLLRRCRHAASTHGEHIYIYGGLKGGRLLDDLVLQDDSLTLQKRAAALGTPASPGATDGISGRKVEDIVTPSPNIQRTATFSLAEADQHLRQPSFQEMEAERERPSIEERGEEADMTSVEEGPSDEELSSEEEQQRVSTSRGRRSSIEDAAAAAVAAIDTNDVDGGRVRIASKAAVVAVEPLTGSMRSLVRQMSIDRFEHEGQRSHAEARRSLERVKSVQGIHRKVLDQLLRPRAWKPPADRAFFLSAFEIAELCDRAEEIFQKEPSVLKLRAPIKLFGDIHGQFGDLMRLFDEYGTPSPAGDITYIDYLFLGDYVDRGQHSLETMVLLLSLKIAHPNNVHLIRGNHEDAEINAQFGFRMECVERLGEAWGLWAWQRINQLFHWLPLAALIEKKIFCMHGGIGRCIQDVAQIDALQRPLPVVVGSLVLMDLLWSDPTEDDSIKGLQPNPRGPGLVAFGPDRVMEFCRDNNLQLIVRAHECVMDGFERFAEGHLITLFSATNYCGTANNAGAILVLGRDLVVIPKLIHPLPPSDRTGEELEHDDTWKMDLNDIRPPTPPRGRPTAEQHRNSLAYI